MGLFAWVFWLPLKAESAHPKTNRERPKLIAWLVAFGATPLARGTPRDSSPCQDNLCTSVTEHSQKANAGKYATIVHRRAHTAKRLLPKPFHGNQYCTAKSEGAGASDGFFALALIGILDSKLPESEARTLPNKEWTLRNATLM